MEFVRPGKSPRRQRLLWRSGAVGVWLPTSLLLVGHLFTTMSESRLDVAFRTSPILRRPLSFGFAEIMKVRSTTPQPADSLNVRAVFPALLQLMGPPSSSGRSFLDRS